MQRVKVCGFSLSLDGFGAGSQQTLDDPLGKRGTDLHQWLFGTKTFRAMTGESGGSSGVDENYASRMLDGVGAFIMGRNMFGPIRDDWPDDSWRGWWGDTPPYHAPVFVLTHYPRDPVEMEGGTIFHFVTEGAEAALSRARKVAGNRDVNICGGVSTVRQYLSAGVIDAMHVVISPVLLGSGEALLSGIDLPSLGYTITERAQGDHAIHVVMTRDRS